VSDFGNLIQGHASLFQTELNRSRGKRARVFLEAETLLLRRGNQLSVDEDRGSRVMPLRDAVFGWQKTRPQLLFERHGILKSADSRITEAVLAFCSVISSLAILSIGAAQTVDPGSGTPVFYESWYFMSAREEPVSVVASATLDIS